MHKIYKISVTTIDTNGHILSHQVAKSDDYDNLINILEADAMHINLSTIKDGPISKRHVTGNTTTVVLLPE